MDRREFRGARGIGSGAITLLILAILGIAVMAMAYTPVQRGRVAVIVRFGQVQPDILYPGLHWRIPFVDSVLVYRTEKLVYEASEQPGQSGADYTDLCVDTSSSDGQQVVICYTVRFSIIPEQAAWIANTFFDEGRIVERIVKADSRSWSRAITRNYSAEQLYSGNIVATQEEVFERLQPIYAENAIILDEFLIRDVNFSPEYIQAVEAKQIAEQTVITRQHEAEQAKFEAEKIANLAQGEASARRIRAAAEADAIRLQGEALRSFPEVIQWQFVQSLMSKDSRITWGILPPDLNIVPFLQIPSVPQEGTQP